MKLSTNHVKRNIIPHSKTGIHMCLIHVEIALCKSFLYFICMAYDKKLQYCKRTSQTTPQSGINWETKTTITSCKLAFAVVFCPHMFYSPTLLNAQQSLHECFKCKWLILFLAPFIVWDSGPCLFLTGCSSDNGPVL